MIRFLRYFHRNNTWWVPWANYITLALAIHVTVGDINKYGIPTLMSLACFVCPFIVIGVSIAEYLKQRKAGP